MTEQSTEERLAVLEKEVNNLKRELAKRRTIDGLRTDIQELRARYESHEEYVSDRFGGIEERLDTLNVRLDVIEDNDHVRFQELQTGQQALQAGQEQIIAILTGRAPRND